MQDEQNGETEEKRQKQHLRRMRMQMIKKTKRQNLKIGQCSKDAEVIEEVSQLKAF